MPLSVDELQIELNAKATSANDAVDKLIVKLDKLSASLGRLNGSGINGVANGIDKLGRSMQTINAINSKSFTKLASNIEKLGNINVYNLNSSASAMSNITRAFNQLGGVSQSAQQVTILADSISKLGRKTVLTATQNIPQLANSLSHLMKVLSKAPVVSQNVITLVNSLANLTSQGVKVGNSSNSIVRGLDKIGKTSERTSKKAFSLASAFGTLTANFWWVSNAVKGVWSSFEETSDYIESFNYYTVAFDKIASEWDDKYESYGTENAKKYTNSFVTQMSDSFSKLSGVKLNLSEDLESGILSDTGMKNLGLNIKEVTQYASQLASITNSVGQTGEVSLMTADSFTKLAGDMSSLFNVDFSTVAQNLQSGLIGQSRALYKYGIDITNATLQTYAYEAGIEKAVSEMTQMEKMQLRMIAILDQSKVAWGDLADTIETPANMLRQLSNNVKEASMMLGQLLMPALEAVLPKINGVVIAFKNLLSTIAGFMGVDLSLEDLGQGALEATDDLLDMQEGMEDATDSAKKLKNQLQGFDKLNVITTPKSTETSSSIGGTVDLSAQIEKATQEYQKAWEEAYANMENKAQQFASNVEKALEPIKSLFRNFAIGDYFAVGQDVTNLVVGINNFLTNAINQVDWEKVGENVGNFFKGIEWSEILDSVGELIWSAINGAITAYDSLFDEAPIETAITSAAALLTFTPLGSNLASTIASALSKELASQGTIDTLKKGFITLFKGENYEGTFDSLFETFKTKLAGISSILGGLTLSVGSFIDMWNNGFNWISEAVMLVGIALTAVGAIILGAPALVAGVVAGVVAAFATIAIVIKDNWKEISGFFTNLANGFSAVWSAMSYALTSNVLPEMSRHFRNFVNGILEFFESMANGAISAVNFVIKGLNKIKFDVPSWVPSIGGKTFGFNISLVKEVSIPRFEAGGFPEDGWFRASKGEYFGSFDDGTSVIANNNQIISGISNGVKSANAEQNALLREQNALLRQILAKDTGISTRDIFNAVRSEDREYINRNGESAFAY